MASEADAQASKHAQELYDLAVSESPLNRTQLDHLVDFVRANPTLLFSEYFDKGYNATEVAVGAWHGHAGPQENDESIAFLSTLGSWGWAVMEDTVCLKPPTKQLFKTKYPQLIDRFLNIAERTLKDMEHTPVQIVRRSIQALTRFWPQLYSLCIDDDDGDEVMWSRPFENMRRLASSVHQIAQQSDDPAMLVHLVKFLEVEATIFSPVPANGASKQGAVGIDQCPDPHPYLARAQLEDWGSSARQLLMTLLPSSDTPRLFNTSFITAIINSVVYLMNLRPQFVDLLLGPLMGWYEAANSSHPMMSPSQSTIINKTLRISLFQLYRRPYMGAHIEPLENAMDSLSGPEWVAWQARQARIKEREERQRAKERSRMSRQQQQQLQQQQSQQEQGRRQRPSRWVPAKEDEEDEESMADQPAPLLPGASSGFAGVPPPPPPPPLPANLEAMLEILNKNKLASRFMPPGPGEERGQKRPGPSPAHAGEDEDEDEDEEQQFRMLEESAKRVKLDSGDAAAPPLEQPASVPAATHGARLADTATATTGPPQTAADAEMEEEIRAALHSGPFELPPAEDMTPETCSVQIQQALERVVAGSKAIRRLIETKNMQSLDVSSRGMLSPAQHQEHQLQQHRDITESGVRKVLPNGQSTNAGILEDSMLMLVRLISNCYILCSGADQAYDARPAMGPDSSWSRIHSCVESVLDYILEAPRTHYGLAQLLLYEMWLAVVIADPEMKQVPEQAGSEYSALSLYLNWCQRIFGRIVECSAEHVLAQEKAQVVPDSAPGGTETTGGPLASGGVLAGGSSGAGVPLPQQHQQKQGDRLMLDFIIDVPYLAPQLLRKLQGYLSDPRTALAGIATLKDAIALRPPLLKEGLEILLTYSAHPQKETRTACILAVKKYYINSPFSSLIEKLAKTAIKSGVADAASRTKELEASVAAAAAAVREKAAAPGAAQAAEEGGASKQQQAEGESGSDAQHDPRAEILAMRKNGEAEIEAHLVSHAELFLALCTRNMDLFSEIFDIFVASPPLVQAIIQRIIKPLVRSTARTPAKFIPALERFPKGAENFALRVIILLTLDVAPSPELVQTVLNLFDQRGLGAQFLVVVANGMEKDEIQKRLPAVLGLLDGTEAQRGLVRECFSRLMRPYGGRPSRLSPTQLLIMLHDDLGVGAERTMEAIQVCVDMDKVFTPQILAAALKMMVEMPDVPPLVMRTAELCHRRNRSITGLIIGLLSNLVARKVWEMNGVFEGFAKCCLSLVPATLSLMLSMPAEPLKQMVSMEPSLTAHLHEYVQKMPESKRERFKWLIGASG